MEKPLFLTNLLYKCSEITSPGSCKLSVSKSSFFLQQVNWRCLEYEGQHACITLISPKGLDDDGVLNLQKSWKVVDSIIGK